ncbi:hypothetical protein G6F31_018069 [Rhizopus arrhizus]|nr:hypothetical protein G6F31_018069 [Rhizopus arrhizus]
MADTRITPHEADDISRACQQVMAALVQVSQHAEAAAERGWVSTRNGGHPMKARPDTLRHLQCCLDVIASSEPMTEAERAEHRSRCAEEQARAEARRAGDGAPDLLGAPHA